MTQPTPNNDEKAQEPIIEKPYIFVHPSQDFEGDLGYYLASKEEPDFTSKNRNVGFSHMLVVSDGRILPADDKEQLHSISRVVLRNRPSGLIEERWDYAHIQTLTDPLVRYEPFTVFTHLKELIEKYIELQDKEWYSILPLWIMGTYIFSVFPAYPYLAIHGFKGSGKSKTGDLIARLSFNGLGTVGISEASLFRIVEANRATLIIDEGEQLNSRSNHKADTIRQLLNAGYKKGTKVIRQEKDKNGNFEPKSFDPYSPKVIVSIAGLEDVLGSRAITLMMLRAKSNKGHKQLTDIGEAWSQLRHELYCFGLENFQDVRISYTYDENIRIGKNRANDLWSPLLAIAKVVFKDHQEQFDTVKNFAALQIEKDQVDEEVDEITYAIVLALEDISVIEGWISNKDVYETACGYLESHVLENFQNGSVGYRMKRLGIEKKRNNDGVKYFVTPALVQDLKERFGIKR